MVLVGQRDPAKGHYTVTGKLVDRALMAVDFVHQDLEAAVHDLMSLLGAQFSGKSHEIGRIGEYHGHQLALAFDGRTRGENLIGQVLGV
jgi:hypothetical protein